MWYQYAVSNLEVLAANKSVCAKFTVDGHSPAVSRIILLIADAPNVDNTYLQPLRLVIIE